MSDQKLVERAEGAKAKLDGGAAEVMPSKKSQIGAEIIPLKFFPGRGFTAFFVVPAGKLLEGLAIIALGVGRCAAAGGEVLEEFGDGSHAEKRDLRVLTFHECSVLTF